MPANFKRGSDTHQKETKSPTQSTTSMTTTRSQSLAMSTSKASSAPLEPESPESIPSQESPLSPEWIHAITILMGHQLTSLIGQHIQKWILYQGILIYTDLVITWDPIQFENNRHLQEYEETNGSIAYLKANTVKQLVSFRNYMILLISQGRPADQKHNTFYFLLGEQWFILTAHDMRTALVNAGLENHRSQTIQGTPMSNFTSPSSSASMRSPIDWELAYSRKI